MSVTKSFLPQYILIIYLWSCDTCHGGAWRGTVQTSLQGLVAPAAGSAASGQSLAISSSGGSLYAVTHQGGGIRAWPLDMSGNPEGPFSFQSPHGVIWSHWPVFQLDFSLCPNCFFPLASASIGPKGTPNKHPNTKLHLGLYPREPTCSMYQKTF